MKEQKVTVNPLITEKRKQFSSKLKREVRDRQLNCCAVCDASLFNDRGRLRPYAIDHIKPLWGGGDNSLDNLQALCKECHSKKTALEATSRAKADRQRRFMEEGRGKKRKGPAMQSRGFDKTLRRKMNGEVVRLSGCTRGLKER